MMKTNILLVIGLAHIFLSGCAQMSPIANDQNNEYSAELRTIDPSNHDAMATYYEEAANEMKAKLQAQKKRLEDYDSHSYYYGRRGQDVRSHTTANIRMYVNTIKENMKEAALHRRMAQEQKKQEFGLRREEATDSPLN